MVLMFLSSERVSVLVIIVQATKVLSLDILGVLNTFTIFSAVVSHFP